MKDTVTEYETEETVRTVKDYETVEKEKEVVRSDLSGEVIDDDEVVELHTNFKIESVNPDFKQRLRRTISTDWQIKNKRHLTESRPKFEREFQHVQEQKREVIDHIVSETLANVQPRSHERIHISESEFKEIKCWEDMGVKEKYENVKVRPPETRESRAFSTVSFWSVAFLKAMTKLAPYGLFFAILGKLEGPWVIAFGFAFVFYVFYWSGKLSEWL